MSAHVHHMILSHLSIYVINVIWGMKIYVKLKIYGVSSFLI